MKKFILIFDRLFHIMTAISFGLVTFCVLTQVITRYTPGISAPWTDEMTRLFFLYTIMFGAPISIRYREYAAIDVVSSNLHGVAASLLTRFNYVIVAIVSFVGVRQAYILFLTGFRTVSTTLRTPMWIFYLVPVGIFLLTFLFCIEGFITAGKHLEGEEV